jgi:hypothetical protein
MRVIVYFVNFKLIFKDSISYFLFPYEIDNSHYKLILKLGKEMQINHHS